MDQTKAAKKIFENKQECTCRRKLRRPVLRCLEVAENDLRGLKEKRWSQKANNG
jgi:hypothetical protein